MTLITQLESFIKTIQAKQMPKGELLLGQCQSGAGLTNTQEHILMEVAGHRLSSAGLAAKLNISQAAITKATKILERRGFLIRQTASTDKRVMRLVLTDIGRRVAMEHASHHKKSQKHYQNVLDRFSNEEQATIERFLGQLEKEYQQ